MQYPGTEERISEQTVFSVGQSAAEAVGQVIYNVEGMQSVECWGTERTEWLECSK